MDKVRANAKYVYRPVFFDVLNPPFDVTEGEIVRVVNLPGCPKANTMRMCHVETQQEDGTWKFSGMVCTASLHKIGKEAA